MRMLDSKIGSVIFQENPTVSEALTAFNFLKSQYKDPVSEILISKKHCITDRTPKVLGDVPKVVQSLEIGFFSGIKVIVY